MLALVVAFFLFSPDSVRNSFNLLDGVFSSRCIVNSGKNCTGTHTIAITTTCFPFKLHNIIYLICICFREFVLRHGMKMHQAYYLDANSRPDEYFSRERKGKTATMKNAHHENRNEKKNAIQNDIHFDIDFFFSFHYFAQRRCPLCCCSRSSELGAQDEWLYSWETNKKLLRQPQRINCAACAAWAINIYVERVKSEWMFLTYKSKWQKDDIRTILCTLFDSIENL